MTLNSFFNAKATSLPGGMHGPVQPPVTTSFFDTVGKVAGFAAPLITATGKVMQGEGINRLRKAEAAGLEAEAGTEAILSDFEIEQQRKTDKQFRGEQKLAFSKAGIEMEGSALEAVAMTAQEQEFNILAMKYNSEKRQRTLRTQAGVKRAEGAASRSAGYYGGGETILNSGIFRNTGDIFKKKTNG